MAEGLRQRCLKGINAARTPILRGLPCHYPAALDGRSVDPSALPWVANSLFRLGAELSPYVGFTLAMATMVLLGVQAFGFIRVWPRRTTPEHPVVFGVYWGLILGLIVPGAVATLLDKGVFGLLSAVL